MAGDALSDLLRTVRLTGAIFFDVAAKEPWVVEQPPREVILRRILPGAEHLISYHVVIEGRCYASIVGEKPISVETGEIIVITNGDPHVMSSSPNMRADPLTPEAVEAATAGQLPFVVNFGGEGPASAKLVCGFLACDARPFNPLIENLPRVIKVKDRKDDDAGTLGRFIRFALIESANKRAGGETVLAKLSELMFIEVIRQHLETLPAERAGWLAGLRDPFVGKALSLLHREPARSWTIEDLAKQVGLSRSVLAERFVDLMGISPMQYLAKWRMQIASGILSAGNTNMATIAAEIGYESEAAFSRAFKRLVGVPPSLWRRRVQPLESQSDLKPMDSPGRQTVANGRKLIQ
jgi:AraC-like DNA-binding protein